MQLRIQVNVNAFNDPDAYGDLSVSETIELRAMDFMDMSKILARFHELADEVRKKNNQE